MSQRHPVQKLPRTESEKPGYGVVMFLYLATGAVGSIFLAILRLRDWGLLKFDPYEHYAIQVFLLFGLGLLMAYGWILGLFLIIRYRYSWRVIVPAATLVAVRVLGLVATVSAYFGRASPIPPAVSDVAIHFYFIAAFLIGIEWLVRKISISGDHPPTA